MLTAARSMRPRCCPPGPALTVSIRDLPAEVPVPFDIPVLYQDTDLVVVDKPHFSATMPRGRHVAQSALVRLRRELGLPELSPAHRLDRLTAGVLLFTTRRELRGAYQTPFARGFGEQDLPGAGGCRPRPGAPAGGAKPHRQAPGTPAGGLRTRCAQRRDAGGADFGRSLPPDAADRTHPPAAGAHGLARDTDQG